MRLSDQLQRTDGLQLRIPRRLQLCGVRRDGAEGERTLGRIMMDAAENWLRETGIEKLQLMVRPDNKGVKNFYQSLGYSEQERVIYAKRLDGREPTP